MLRRIVVAIVPFALVLSLSTVTLAQDDTKKEAQKQITPKPDAPDQDVLKQEAPKPAEKLEVKYQKKEMKHEMRQMLKSVSCNPDCGFMCRSHDENELAAIVIAHAKSTHNMTMTEADVKKMMKTEHPMKVKAPVKGKPTIKEKVLQEEKDPMKERSPLKEVAPVKK